MKRYSKEVKQLCLQFYVKGWTIQNISLEMNIEERTLYNWRKEMAWDDVLPELSVEQVLAKRLGILAEREQKTEAELVEFDGLIKQFGSLKLQLAEADRLRLSPASLSEPIIHADNETADTPKKKRARGKKSKNDISGISEEQLLEVLHEVFFEYQLLWWQRKEDKDTRRNRFILKSRQIGATYYFAFEAFADAVVSGENQIFLSASRDQAEVFKAYIIAFAKQYFEVELKGQGVITLSNGAELRFLSTNSRTAQSYHGHLYIDEVFWIPDFAKMWKVASGMAAHKKWRRTLFSTPSAMSHPAYPMWCGDKFNEGKDEKNKLEFDVSHKTLKNGDLGADKIWRHCVTVKDAEAQGCELFDIDELKTEYSTDDFANLFMCKFIDDAKSVFSLATLMNCYAPDDYLDYQPNAPRPFANRPVALGYDPSRTRDNASLAILAIPLRATDKWRVLKTIDYHGQNFQYQAARIKEIVDSHNVQHCGIDITGIGYGLFELVEQFYRQATPINYSNETKTQLVLKAVDVIENKRLEFQAGDKHISQAFMMITKTTTNGGIVTYSSNRNSNMGHADVAWSIMHALSYEPIANNRVSSTATFSH